MHARVSTLQMDPGRIDDAVRQLEDQDVPKLQQADGYWGLTLFGDRSSGKVVAASYWDSQEQMDAAEDAGRDARQRAAETGGATGEPQVERFEVVLDTFVR
jgi:heme-degrading monooxygenase HmoA